MAQATYTSPQITAQTRKAAYMRLSDLCLHMVGLSIDLVSIIRNPDNTVSITVSGPINQEQLDHLGLV